MGSAFRSAVRAELYDAHVTLVGQTHVGIGPLLYQDTHQVYDVEWLRVKVDGHVIVLEFQMPGEVHEQMTYSGSYLIFWED